MKNFTVRFHPGLLRIGLTVACVLFLLLFSSLCRSDSGGGANSAEMSAQEAFAFGERMYRNGILPSGEHMKATVPGGAPARGVTFACAACHLRSGLGAKEDRLIILPINGKKLFQPQFSPYPELEPSERETLLPLKFQTLPLRDAYTDETLALAIREGTNPRGRMLDPIMPRYQLSKEDTKILIDYLRNLNATNSPGASETTLAFATVVTDDVAPEDSEAMLKVFEKWLNSHNNLLRQESEQMGRMINMQLMALSKREWTLAVWVLKGPPDTWQDQLNEYYSKEPVFALLGGISNGPWEQIHRFCETRRIPCILPVTELPVVSLTEYYTLYFSKGYYQEGEAAARYLKNLADTGQPSIVLEVVGFGARPAALAKGFEDTWKETADKPAETIVLRENAPIDAETLAGLMKGRGSCALLLWTGPEAFKALKDLAALSDKPANVIMSSSLLGGGLWDLPIEARQFTLLSYPWREPGEKQVTSPMGGRPFTVNKEYRKNDRRIASRTESLVQLLNNTVPMMERNFYRDYLLDLIDQMEDQILTDYEKLTFVPGKRYASDGCYIMKLGRDSVLTPESDWVQN